MSEQPKLTVNDIIHNDERVVKIKQEYNQLAHKKNQLILELSNIESDIMKTMGKYELMSGYDCNEVTAMDNTKYYLVLDNFKTLAREKAMVIEAVKQIEQGIILKEKSFETLANLIVEELKARLDEKTQDVTVSPETVGANTETGTTGFDEDKCVE